MDSIDIKTLANLYSEMLRIRLIEEAIADEYTKQEMRCPTHLCIGQEAIAAGVCNNLHIKDKVFSGHRAHGHYLAKGGDLNAFIAELYGCANGCSRGYGGSMHITDLDAGFVGSTPIVGGTIPLAAGSAWRSKLLGDDDISVVFFGDGCFEEGVLHESLTFAKLHQLPILFVCENNLYSVYTQLKERQSDSRSIAQIASAHGIKTLTGDGNDVLMVDNITKNSIEHIKKNNGPVFLELFTYRWLEHCGPYDDDELKYRPEGELNSWKEKCPVNKASLLLKETLSLDFFKQLELEIKSEIKQAFELAKQCPKPVLNQQGELAHYA